MNSTVGQTRNYTKPFVPSEHRISACKLTRNRAAKCYCSPAQTASSAAEVVAIIEGPEQSTFSDLNVSKQSEEGNNRTTAGSTDPKEPLYKALLAIILKLSQTKQQQQSDEQQQQQHSEPHQQQLELFLRSQPVATSIPFIAWLADLEAAATGAQKAQLCALCEALVMFREQQDREAQEQLHSDTLRLLSGGDKNVAALMSADPRQYALALAEGLTGQAITVTGFSPAYDALLAVAPPATLSPEGVARGHALAAELAADLTSRRRSTLAALMGRARVTPEQQAQLMGGSPAARICDLLLALGSSQERLALLPDCFTPPDDTAEDGGGGNSSGTAATAAAADEVDVHDTQEMDELWCTPMQLLNEIELRLKVAAVDVSSSSGSSNRAALGPGNSSSSMASQPQPQLQLASSASASTADDQGLLSREAAVAALQQLRAHIRSSWLESLPQHGSRQ